MKQSLTLFLFLLLSIGISHAQVLDEPYMTWGEFVTSYLDAEGDEENAVANETEREWLEYVAQNPLQRNKSTHCLVTENASMATCRLANCN